MLFILLGSQLFCFLVLLSLPFTYDVFTQAGFHRDITLLWKEYPHNILDWGGKLYFISQVIYDLCNLKSAELLGLLTFYFFLVIWLHIYSPFTRNGQSFLVNN